MPYPEIMQASLRRVEETRPRRLRETHRRATAAERQELLARFHPDYIAAAMRPLRVGPSRGDRTPLELARLLEGRSRLDPDAFDLTWIDHDVDVLVVGGGGAGAAAALLAQEHGARVLLATKLRLGDANTMMAQGGIQAADKPNDSPALHYLDVLGGGHFANAPDLVAALVRDAPEVVAWLERLGCMFDKLPDGTMRTEHGGGTSRRRMHSARDYTGAEIMRTLRDEVWNREIPVLEFSPAVELVADAAGRAAGAVLLNLETGDLSLVRARSVVLATGGSGRLHYQGFPTTNHYGATGDGLVLAYRLGAPLAFVDTMQYHPTGVAYPEQLVGLLVTEKTRSVGAQLVNALGEQFFHPLETRDAVAAAIIRECRERGLGVPTSAAPGAMRGVWLDFPLIELLRGAGAVGRLLPAMVRMFRRFGIDLTREPALVYPTLHYQNGGVAIDPEGRTAVPGLFVAGEASGGVHGRNRLMGNSLLDVLVFGRRAGAAAARAAAAVTLGPLSLAHVRRWHGELADAGLADAAVSPLLLPDYAQHARETAALG